MIRLIETSKLSVHVFEGRSIPRYAILSHRWEEDEIGLEDLQKDVNRHKRGWLKLQNFCQYAKGKGHHFVWVDTCCIDKSSSAELSEAINSMFNWYRRADTCYAYLHDVPAKDALDTQAWMEMFKRSVWFTRGWTLQELLAPRELTFVCRDWKQEIGSRMSLCREVSEVTKVPEKPLATGWSFRDQFGAFQFTVAQIMSWASTRNTTRVEDTAYSLMGLFRINMPLLYGEGPNAFVRLQTEIMSKYDDNSLFAWRIPLPNQRFTTTRAMNQSLGVPDAYPWGGLLAPAIQCFQSCTGHFAHLVKYEDGVVFSMTSRGVKVKGLLRRYKMSLNKGNGWLLPLNCGRDELWTQRLGVVLAGEGQFAMRVVNMQGFDPDLVDCDCDEERFLKAEYEYHTIFVPQAWPGDFDLDRL